MLATSLDPPEFLPLSMTIHVCLTGFSRTFIVALPLKLKHVGPHFFGDIFSWILKMSEALIVKHFTRADAGHIKYAPTQQLNLALQMFLRDPKEALTIFS